MTFTKQQIVNLAKRAGRKLAKQKLTSGKFKNININDIKVVRATVSGHVWSDMLLESLPNGVKINWSDKAIPEAFFAAYVSEVQKHMGKSTGKIVKVNTISQAQQAGMQAAKISDLKQIDRHGNIKKQISDLADEAWEHDGMPAFDTNDSKIINTYTKAFQQELKLRLKKV